MHTIAQQKEPCPGSGEKPAAAGMEERAGSGGGRSLLAAQRTLLGGPHLFPDAPHYLSVLGFVGTGTLLTRLGVELCTSRVRNVLGGNKYSLKEERTDGHNGESELPQAP